MSAPRRRASERLISWIVRLYPRAIRDPYGEELTRDTTLRWHEARARGWFAAAAWWLREGGALLIGAGKEHGDRALRRGGLSRTKRSRGTLTRSGMMADVRWLLREMRRNLGFSLSLIVVLSLALGLSTGVFAFVDGVLMKPLHYASGERIVAVWASRPTEGLDRVPLTQWDINRLKERSDVFESVGAFTQQRSSMQLPDRVIEIGFGWITTGIHDVLDVEPLIGRTFTDAERGELIALLDHGFWQRQFGGDPDILGQTIRIAQQPWTIVGVLPPETPLELPSRGRVPQPTDVWSFMWVDGEDASSAWMRTVARLAPGVSTEQAREAAEVIAAEGRRLFPERDDAGFEFEIRPLREDFTAGISRQLWLLLAGTLVLLFAAITNAGNLMLLQRERRRRRTAVRLAIGASKRQLNVAALVEALLFATAAAVLALPIAELVLSGLLSWTPTDVPRLDQVDVDGRAVVFLGVAAVATTLLLGALSMAWTSDVPTDDVIRRSRGDSAGWSGGRLVAAEVAVALPLLIVGALLTQSARTLAAVDPGFEAEGAVALRLALPNHELSREELSVILDDFHERLAAIPGVQQVGSSNIVPLGGGAFTGPVGLAVADLDEAAVLEGDYRYITTDYLEALAVDLVDGAWPRASDPETSVVIDEALADRLWPDQPAIGRTLAARPLGDVREDFTVIGVVSTTRHEGLREAGRPTVYFTSRNYTLPYVTTIVRGDVEARDLFAQARAAGAEAHPDFLVAEARGLDDLVAATHALSTWLVVLVVALGLGAATITAVGLYAIVGQFVSGYARAIGIRRALGARTYDLVRLVVRRVATTVVIGLVLGSVLAVVASSFVRSELVGIGPTDPVTWLLVVGAVVLLTALAITVPTRGATRVSPLEALRSE